MGFVPLVEVVSRTAVRDLETAVKVFIVRPLFDVMCRRIFVCIGGVH